MSLSKLMHINEIPPHVFTFILDNIPLHQQLRLRSVCKKWKLMISKRCAKMNSLKLFGSLKNVTTYCQMLVEYGLDDSPYYREAFRLYSVGQDDDLIGGKDKDSKCHFLVELFTNISHLTIDYNDLEALDVPFLICRFSKLSSLTILHVCIIPKPILNAINNNRRLMSLALFNKTSGKQQPHTTRMQLPILGQLERFFFAGYNSIPIQQVLSQLGPKISHLFLAEMDIPIFKWKQFLASKSSLRKSLTHLTVYATNVDDSDDDYHDFQLLKLICANCPSLTFLDLIQFTEIPTTYLFKELSKLTKLSHLHVYLDEEFYEPLEGAILPSIKNLNLQAFPSFQLDDFSKAVPHIETLTYQTACEQKARQLSAKARDEFTGIRQFIHTSPVAYDRAFIGRHYATYHRYYKTVKARLEKEETDEESCPHGCLIS